MTNDTLIPAKATADSERSNAIVVSFAADWHQHLLAKDFSVVIRKRVPTNRAFEWLYFHINTPVGAICGRAQIESIIDLTMEHAAVLAREINLSPDEIKSYFAGNRYIGCYKLGAFQFGNRPIHTAELTARMIYHPPQSFFILSKRAKEIVDQMAGFIQLEAGHPRQPQKT